MLVFCAERMAKRNQAAVIVRWGHSALVLVLFTHDTGGEGKIREVER